MSMFGVECLDCGAEEGHRKNCIRLRPARLGSWMQTYTGIQFWPLDPRPEEIVLQDIAHALAHQCRFAGHVSEFYSVAQHSVMVSQIVPEPDRAWGLMHDAAEAYLQDMIRPLKHGVIGDEYRKAEERLMAVICERFGLPADIPDSVKHADNVLLITERRDLKTKPPADWDEENFKPLPTIIRGWTPRAAKWEFLTQAGRLGIK